MEAPVQRDNILKAARRLFYENGYVNTFFGQIADECGITKPLISYYFKSKSALAREVSEQFIREIKNVVSMKLYESFYRHIGYDLQVSTAVEIKITDRLFFDDENFMRFFLERAGSNFDDFISGSYKPLYEIHDRKYRLDINREADELSMLARAASAMTTSLRLAYLHKEFNCTYEEYADYTTGMHFRLMRIPDERIDEINRLSNDLLLSIRYRPLPNFGIELQTVPLSASYSS